MKCLPGLAAVLLIATAHSQTPVISAAAAPEAAEPENSVPDSDVATATRYVKDAWSDFTHCRRPSACDAYFESFGVAISFADGSIAPFKHLQRLTASSRDCIKTARAYLEKGDRSLAVQWAMAARIENVPIRDWMGNHPDAVLIALRRCCG